MQIGVAYSEAGQQIWLTIEVPDEATVEQAIARSGILAMFPQIDLAAAGRHLRQAGELEAPLRPGDRIEIYRPITCDPQIVPVAQASGTIREPLTRPFVPGHCALQGISSGHAGPSTSLGTGFDGPERCLTSVSLVRPHLGAVAVSAYTDPVRQLCRHREYRHGQVQAKQQGKRRSRRSLTPKERRRPSRKKEARHGRRPAHRPLIGGPFPGARHRSVRNRCHGVCGLEVTMERINGRNSPPSIRASSCSTMAKYPKTLALLKSNGIPDAVISGCCYHPEARRRYINDYLTGF